MSKESSVPKFVIDDDGTFPGFGKGDRIGDLCHYISFCFKTKSNSISRGYVRSLNSHGVVVEDLSGVLGLVRLSDVSFGEVPSCWKEMIDRQKQIAAYNEK